jgi:LysR family transcriptional regulator, glycine cleavage system transcriptional activator
VGSAYDRLPLNALRVFEAVAARLNFGEAAEALHVTPAAVSQQIKVLEDYLQTPLFRRSGRKVELTPEGAQLLPGVRRGLDELETTLQRLKRGRQTGAINVSVLSSFLQKWLTPRLADLRTQHPELELRMHSSPELIDFARTDFHAAVRLGTGRYPGLHVQKLLDDWLVAVAAPRVLKKYGVLAAEAELDARPLLHGGELDWSGWSAGGAESRKAQRGAYMDDSASMLAAAIEGLGFAIIRWSLVANDLAAGRVALASERVIPYKFSYYFVCPKAYIELPKLAILRDWLLEQARGFAAPPLARK